MEAKDKAKELFDKYADEFDFDDTYRGYREQSKQCALIAVDEILDIDCHDMSEENFNNHIKYWDKVKQEIIKLNYAS